ncbi:MAG: DNA methyltransferase, partial [Myxococcales bacterium]
RHPDTMDLRFGAYAWLLSTFRMVFDGGAHGRLHLPTRHGQLFNPDEYPFLEGRPPGVGRVMGDTFEAPRVSDGVLWRVLDSLLVLDGERLSYRSLDVEQVGSVYEAMMGFDVRTLPGRAIAVRPNNVVFDLDALLAVAGPKRAAWLKEQTECDLADKGTQALKAARTVEDVVVALGKKVAPQTDRALAPGAMFLQPGEERRRSGSHYTPRELTEPIVRTTLSPVLEALGQRPTPEQILDLKVCDPAMGSGAFLVEACRQLAAALVAAWETYDSTPLLPPDEDPLLHARRLIAQRCLYGVDKNHFAVNLAKLSLWLVTLAKDHAFTFLDHALKHGDSLVGLTKAQLGAFHWSPPGNDYGPLFAGITADVIAVTGWRAQIQALGEGDYDQRRLAWKEAEDVVRDVRRIGDLCIAAYFGAEKDKDREALRRDYRGKLDAWKAGGDRLETDGIVDELRSGGGERPVLPLHWEIEFPEVFGRGNPGFDAMVGNPPFLGGSSISSNYGNSTLHWLLALHEKSHGNGDLVAHFYRRAFSLVREHATFGLIATNTIGQGDTRSTGLQWICTHGGEIYAATRRVKWPGLAAVVVSVVHVCRGPWVGSRRLDGREVPFISAFLFHGGAHEPPQSLADNVGRSFLGSKVYGQGFTFDDNDKSGVASPLAEMHRLIAKDPRNADRIFPYIGGEEVNTSPTHAHHRYVINFGEMTEEEALRWPDLMGIVEAKVKPDRDQLADNPDGRRRRAYWWQWGRDTPALSRAIAGLDRVLANSQVSTRVQFAFLPINMVYAHTLNVFPLPTHAAFALLQSRPHELWARFFGSSLEDRLRYTPSDCFETFPFPPNWQSAPTMEAAGQTYYDFRAALMVRNDQGLTKTYNRFHSPNECDPDIFKLRELHSAMDRAVLDAYGWSDIATDCDFLLDYEIDEATWGDKKKPFRYRWPDAVRDEVLARLLDLNQRRHQEEVVAGLHGKVDKGIPVVAKKPRGPRKARTAKGQMSQETLALAAAPDPHPTLTPQPPLPRARGRR